MPSPRVIPAIGLCLAIASIVAAAPAGGASTHWSFQPPRDHPAPDVKDSARVRTPVDRFIQAALEAKGLKPSAEADRRTLIRRATYDLHGLPPSADDVEAFV